MRVPVLLFGQCLIDAVIEITVMREYDMSADVVQLDEQSIASQLGEWHIKRRTKPSGVTSVEARPPGVSFESMIIHDGPS